VLQFRATRFSTQGAIICSAWESVAGSRPPRRQHATAPVAGGNGAGKTLAHRYSGFRYSVFATARAGIEIGSVRSAWLRALHSYARRRTMDVSPPLRLGVVLQSGVGYELSGRHPPLEARIRRAASAANGLDSTRTQRN